MTIKPFLSHRRENAIAVSRLRDTLRIYGAGAWKDTENLASGARTPEAVRRAIQSETGGFIWWGTRSVLESWFVNEVEVPAALARKSTEASYPVVPLFVDLDPGRPADSEAIRFALGDWAKPFLECNGFVRRRSERADEFRRRAARRYVLDGARSLLADSTSNDVARIAIRAMSEPTGDAQLTFDWRSLFDPDARVLTAGALPILRDALATTRDALQASASSPAVLLDTDLPLPLAFLVGFEWRITTRIRLTVRQRTGASFAEVEADGDVGDVPEASRRLFGGHGPVVLALSSGTGPGQAATRYASSVGAQELVQLHVPGVLSAPLIRGLARAGASELRALNNRGLEKHLLILGPSALAVFSGAAANACGPVTLPFWNGRSYVAPLVIGEYSSPAGGNPSAPHRTNLLG